MVINFRAFAVPNWMDKLKNGNHVSRKILESVLHPLMSADEASQAVDYGIQVGILVPWNKKGVTPKGKQISLSFSQNVKKLCKSLKLVSYCYECHSSGSPEQLQICRTCERHFHKTCQRKNPNKPNYSMPVDQTQLHQFLSDDSDSEELCDEKRDEEGEQVERRVTTTTPAPNINEQWDGRKHHLDFNSNINEWKREAESSDDDVLFVGEKKACQRKRSKTLLVKNEHDQRSAESTNASKHNELEQELELCTACRLQKLADLLIPPRVSVAELNCLLDFSWRQHSSWLQTDIRKYIDQNWTKHDAKLVKSVLFKNDVLGVYNITENIDMKRYTKLADFVIDLLDLQHNFGVFYGPSGDDFEATKYLLRDVTHDVREISRCADCFRHSNEANHKFWFAKPCFQRHELVYAKAQGSPHWPAKIIRVIRKKITIYDVRFFGGSHSRAFVPEHNILQIDSRMPQLDRLARSSRNFKAAMLELRCHEMLLNKPIELFDFHANPSEAEHLINHSLSLCMEASELSSPIKHSSGAAAPASKKRKIITTATTPNVFKRVQPMRRCSMARQGLLPIDPPATTVDSELLREVSNLKEQLIQKQQELEQLIQKQQELEQVKRKRWCQNCLQLAKFDCCFTASYCSADCKRRDKRKHQRTCASHSKN
ncbi:uncharacterized protein LOC6568815 [Drosophila grimshawi]|uniref:GH22740 n=1 Tax=Drosophila grimshawi TaxID=7222 RepID=B4JWG9_DROGR|nr:uncharacterized protein LOC6568815 [Drosophila grimshawi]EDV98307.1 GH22740 [Drosophila grimshawi]